MAIAYITRGNTGRNAACTVLEEVFIKHLSVWWGRCTFYRHHPFLQPAYVMFKFEMPTFYVTLFVRKILCLCLMVGYPPPPPPSDLSFNTSDPSTFSLMSSVLAAGPVHTRAYLRPGIRGEHWPLWVNSPCTNVRERARYTVLW